MPPITTMHRLAAAGLLLLVLGAAASASRTAATGAAALLGLGGGLVLLAAVPLLRALPAILRGRAARRGADAVLATLLFAAILVVIQATSMHHSHQFDLTRNRRHTLSAQTLTLLSTLDREVTATAFFREGSALRDSVRELLDLYARGSPRFRYSLVDPDRHPDLVQRLGAAPDEIVVEAGTRRRIASPPGEQTITNALLQATRTEPRAIYFVGGHGERDIESADRDGYSAAKKALEAQGYSARPLPLLASPEVPSDAAVVAIAGPRTDYLKPEVDALSAYVRRGGSLLFLLDPRTDLPRVEALLSDYRLSVLDAVVLDERELRTGDRTFDATVVKVRRYERHPITRGFNYLTMYPRARPVLVTPDSATNSVDARYLAITDERSWGELDMEAFARGTASRDRGDIAGPLPVAAVARRRETTGGARRESRAVLVGDSDFANNVFLGLLGNSDWLLNIVAFLAEEEEMISIRPRSATGDAVYLSQRDGRLVFVVCIVLMPLTGVLSGAAVMLRRRRL